MDIININKKNINGRNIQCKRDNQTNKICNFWLKMKESFIASAHSSKILIIETYIILYLTLKVKYAQTEQNITDL